MVHELLSLTTATHVYSMTSMKECYQTGFTLLKNFEVPSNRSTEVEKSTGFLTLCRIEIEALRRTCSVHIPQRKQFKKLKIR